MFDTLFGDPWGMRWSVLGRFFNMCWRSWGSLRGDLGNLQGESKDIIEGKNAEHFRHILLVDPGCIWESFWTIFNIF